MKKTPRAMPEKENRFGKRKLVETRFPQARGQRMVFPLRARVYRSDLFRQANKRRNASAG